MMVGILILIIFAIACHEIGKFFDHGTIKRYNIEKYNVLKQHQVGYNRYLQKMAIATTSEERQQIYLELEMRRKIINELKRDLKIYD